MTETTTRKIIFEEKYKQLIIDIKHIIGNNELMPDIENINVLDIFFMFTLYFQNANKENYKELIDDLLKLKKIKISQDNIILLYPIIIEFIVFIKSIN